MVRDWREESAILKSTWDMIDMMPFFIPYEDGCIPNTSSIMWDIRDYIHNHPEHPVWNYMKLYPDVFVNNEIFYRIDDNEFYDYCQRTYPNIKWKRMKIPSIYEIDI